MDRRDGDDRALQVVRLADRPGTLWANGGGTTVELARHGPDAGPFDWRLSIASETSSAWFSRFDDVDRVLVPMSPDVLRIEIDGNPTVAPFGAVVRFRGEDRVRVVEPPEDGRALNLMVRRSAGVPAIDVLVLDRARHETVRSPHVVAIVVLQGQVTVGTATVRVGDALIHSAGPRQEWPGARADATGRAVLAVVRVMPAS